MTSIFNTGLLRKNFDSYVKAIEYDKIKLKVAIEDEKIKGEKGKESKKNILTLSYDNKVNFSELLRIVNYFNSNYHLIASILLGEYCINHVHFENDKVFNDFVDLDVFLEPITFLSTMPRDAIFLILMSYDVSFSQDDWTKKNKRRINVPTSISLPPAFKFGNVVWHSGIDRAIGAYRYINNFDVGDCITKCEHVMKSSLSKDSKMYREAKLYSYYVNTVLNQSRSINVAKSVMSMILMSFVGIVKKQEVCPGIAYLQALYSKCQRWPFLDTTLGMRWMQPNGVSSQVPLLTYSILNRMVSWYTDVIDTEIFDICMDTYFQWSITSLDDEHLNQKGKMNKVRKLLNECVLPGEVLQFNNVDVSGTKFLSQNDEFWLEGEKDELLDIVMNSRSTRMYFDFVAKCLNTTMSRDECVKLKMALSCVTNPSNYKKSSPILEFDRSAEGKPKNTIFTGVPVKRVGNFPIEMRYSGVCKRIWDRLMAKMDRMRLGMNVRNLESEYYDRLTNNSAGMTQQRVNAKKSSNPLLRAMPTIPYGSRYVSALIDNEVLYNKVELIASLSDFVKAGKREQIDRRSRWIMMVMNGLQVVFSVALSFSREFQATNPYIASGKQVGDVRDMLQSLRSSANPNSLITDNDIVGMDSSTQEQISGLILYAVYHSLEGLDIPQFFYASGKECEIGIYDENDKRIGTEMKYLNAAQVYLIEVVQYMRSNPFEFTEGILADTVKLPSAAFWSGAFHTAGQHNTILGVLLELVNEEYVLRRDGVQMKINGAILGDDLSVEVYFNHMDSLREQYTTEFIMKLRSDLFDLGFEADPESSRFEATFLQQSAFRGAVVPKHARISIFCSETGIARSRNPFDQISELGDILDELSARVNEPERCNAVLISLWMMNHVIRLNRFKGKEKSYNKRFANLKRSEQNSKWINMDSQGLRITIPFVAIYMPDINGSHFPIFFDACGKHYQPSFYTPRGTIVEWFMIKMSQKYLKTPTVIAKLKHANLLHREKIGKRKVEMGLMTEAELFIHLGRDYGVNVHDMIDYDLLDRLGFTFAQWLFKELSHLTRLSLEEKFSIPLAQLVEIGKQKLDPIRSHNSSAARQSMNDAGVEVSPGLAYYNQPRNRISQAIEASKNDTKMKFNAKILEKLISYFTHSSKKRYKFKDTSILNFSVTETESEIDRHVNSIYLRQSGICPCVNELSNGFYLQQVFGLPFGGPSVDRVADFFKLNLPVGADPERILDEAIRVMSIDPNLLPHFLIYVGVPSRLHPRIIRMVEEYNLTGVIEYQSIRSTRKFFFISTSLYGWYRYMIDKGLAVGKKRWDILQKSIARDYMLAFPYVKGKIVVSPEIELYNRLVVQE